MRRGVLVGPRATSPARAIGTRWRLHTSWDGATSGYALALALSPGEGTRHRPSLATLRLGQQNAPSLEKGARGFAPDWK